MAGFKISDFRGRYPGIERRHIPENAATIATDVKLGYGDIRPLHGYESAGVELVERAGESAPPGALFLYEGAKWLHFDRDASFVTAPIGQDEWKRLIMTINADTDRAALVAGVIPGSGGVNEVTSGAGPYPDEWYALGIPAPITAPTVTLVSGGGGDVEDQRTVYYCFTQVNDRDEESAPSPPSTVGVVINEALPFAVSVVCQTTTTLTADTFGSQYREPRTVWVYRLFGEDTTRTWMYVGEATVGALGVATFADTYTTASLDGDTLVSGTWDAPPLGLKGVRFLPNGSVVGFVRNQVVLSEPWYPYAFPVNYRYTVDFDIVGLGVFGGTTVVLTTGQPYLLHGSDPGAMSLARLEHDQSCVSRRSIVEYGDHVVWASPDGLMSVGVNGVDPLTTAIMDKRVWRAEFEPETIHAYGYEGLYIAYVGTERGFVINPRRAEDGIVDLSTGATAGYRDLETDTLYVTLPAGAYYGIYAFDADAAAPFEWEWQSRVMEFPAHVSPGRLQLIATGYPLEADTAYLTDTGVYTKYDVALTVQDRNPITLSAGALSTDWQVAIRGTGECEAIVIGETIRDIKGV